MVELKKFERETAEITQLGTFKSNVPKGSTVQFLKNNFLNPEKRVVVFIKKGELTAVVSCTTALSATVRALRKAGKSHAELLGYVVNQEMIENEQGKFISAPANASEAISIDKVVAPVEEEFSPEALAW